MNDLDAAREAQSSLETYAGQVENGERGGDLMVALAAVAICEHLAALTRALSSAPEGGTDV